MTYDQIVTLITIVDAGSFKKASELLSKTQPSLSVSIRKLEEELGVLLFDRSDYRPRLTQEGKFFVEKARQNIEHFRALEYLGKNLSKGIEPKIRMSLEAIAPIHQIKSVLQNFNKTVFNTELEVVVDIIEGTIEKVLDDTVDLAIGPMIYPHPNLEYEKLFCVKMIPVMARENVLSYMPTIDDLKNLPQIIVKSTSKHRSDNGVGILEGGKKWYLSDFSLKKEMIVNGLGWGKLPLHQCQEELLNQSLTQIPFQEVAPIEVELFLLKKKNKIFGKNAQKLWDELIKIKKA